jgi:hypothetical protein
MGWFSNYAAIDQITGREEGPGEVGWDDFQKAPLSEKLRKGGESGEKERMPTKEPVTFFI